ncbi:hypothetical protein HF1_03650 [Mycoplasma haemofelis str. Langford 1]|uniref:Uncharacterized protein n=1 Tax=Mycoplasma haemofelis (strain Langford 1) TaxID=941640 RepID=E8ZGV2_MYCHL|nr:hypothetical protein [Mycoplasma haemofelis]CBY92373.1 hypothetical protein HF1_03650 [Mycoplasma haemofelis str. Langford 1]
MDIKLLGAVGSLGTVAAGSGIYLTLKDRQTPSHTISELFQQEKGWKLMTESNDSKWDEAWTRYKEDKNAWGLSTWEKNKEQAKAIEEFKTECGKRIKSKVFDSKQKEYLEVKKYCSRPKKVSELLSEDKTKTLLDKNGDADKWTAAWDQYKKDHIDKTSGGSNTYKATDEWGIQGWKDSNPPSPMPEAYKSKCEEKWNSHINPEELTEDKTFKQVRSWCTK